MPDQPNPSPRQTLSYIKGLLQSRRLIPKNKMGQNFLIDLNLLDLVVRTAELTKEDCVLEVGTGTGEPDDAAGRPRRGGVHGRARPEFFDMARQLLAAWPNVRQLKGDALASKNELNPELLAGLGRLRRRPGPDPPEAGRQSALRDRHAPHRQPGHHRPADRADGGHGPVGAGRADGRRSRAPRTTGPWPSCCRSVADTSIVRRIAPTNFWPAARRRFGDRARSSRTPRRRSGCRT